MIENILFPVDFSPSCAAMAAYVKRAAAICGARVTLVHVFDLTGHNGFELQSTCLYKRFAPYFGEVTIDRLTGTILNVGRKCGTCSNLQRIDASGASAL